MSVENVRFPDDIAYGSAGGPVFSTDIVTSASGYEKRNSNWSEARAVYNVAHGVKTKAQLDELIAFFLARRGRAHAFRFKDWSDYTAVGQRALPDGVGRYALYKHYQSGEATYLRRIHKPVADTVLVYVDNVLASATINADTGHVSFATPPAPVAIVTVDMEFDVPVRFETDQLVARLDEHGQYSWSDITLVEVRI
jgi:uncharacterized protein (TIGR02217 family)